MSSPRIIDFFPYGAPRPGQQVVLEWIESNWNNYDVMVLQVPVAGGKSGIAMTIGKWANHKFGDTVSITTPDNVLVRQYVRDFKLPTLPRANQFAGRDFYQQAKQDFKEEELKVMNNYTLLANRIYSDIQIMDEAHQLVPMLQDFEGVKIWRHLDWYPDGMKTTADVLMWAASLKNALGKKIVKLISKNPRDYVIVHEEADYRGHVQECLRIYPLTPKNNKPILWPPSKVRKLILMSATIARPDITDLGLHKRRVGYLEVPSDIPKENRPFIYAGQGSTGQMMKSDTLDKCISQLKAFNFEGRGLIHATYKLARVLEANYPNFIYHNSMNKKNVLDLWLANLDDDRVFVGCGLTTGLDLRGDLCRWQAILKCQFPDLGDPAVMNKAMQDPEWYAWTTIKQIVQAYGRVCRAPNDYGITVMLDTDFVRLYTKYSHLFPRWFLEAIKL